MVADVERPPFSKSLDPPLQSAFHLINDMIKEKRPNYTSPKVGPTPPRYFKMGRVMRIDDDINIRINDNYPIGNTGDGVATNIKAARVFRDMYGLHTPEYRCAAHAPSGAIKRLTTTKIMNVPEITVHYDCIQKMVKHFQISAKNKELRDDAIKILEVKPLHFVFWCKTKIGHFLKAEAIFDDKLPAVYDVMFTQNIKPDESDALITPKNLFILKIIAELNYIYNYNSHFLRKADKDNLLVSTVYNTANSFASKVKEFEAANADQFMNSLYFDDKRNLLLRKTKDRGNDHKMLLNIPHKQVCRQSQNHRYIEI